MGAYDIDFHRWLVGQADAIRRRSMNEIDWENLAEEVESLGRSERGKLESYLALIVSHLLKWEAQPRRRGRSWQRTIQNSRRRIPVILRASPSLKATLAETFETAYQHGRIDAAEDLDVAVDALPEAPPFTLDEVMDRRFPDSLKAWEARRGA